MLITSTYSLCSDGVYRRALLLLEAPEHTPGKQQSLPAVHITWAHHQFGKGSDSPHQGFGKSGS